MTWLQRVAARWATGRQPSGRDLQFRTDTARLYITQNAGPASDIVAGAHSSTPAAELPPFEEQLRAVERHLVASVMDHLHRASCVGEPLHRLDAARISATPMRDLNDDRPAKRKSRNGPRLPAAPKKCTVELRNSSVEGAGLGVFVDGFIEAGSVVTLYPGITFRPSEVVHMPDYPNVSKNNEYLLWRYDGIIVDGLPGSVTRVRRALSHAFGASLETADMSHALGHYVNHPGAGSKPNALQFPYDIDMAAVAPRVLPILPNLSWSELVKLENDRSTTEDGDGANMQPRELGAVGRSFQTLEDLVAQQRVLSTNSMGTGSYSHARRQRTCYGLAIVATRPICNEEVFINYRFNPYGAEAPEWYVDCDPEESKRRWAGDGFWG